MPDDVSHTAGQRSVSSHVSQHTSSYTPEPRSELTGAQHPAQAPWAQAAPLRVVVADDNPVVRAGLTVLLGGRDDIEVVAEAADGRQALEAAQQHQPDVVLLDVRMPGVDGISALPYLVRIAPVMMLTYSRESSIVQEALRLGAGGYLVHGEFTADQLVSAIRDIKEGRAHFTATAASALLAQVRSQEPAPGGPLPGPLPEGLGAVYASGVPYEGGSHPPYEPQPRVGGHSASAHTPEAPSVSNSLQSQQNASHVQPVMSQSSQRNREAYGLSSREVEVMDLIASGMSNQQIAATCFISEKTVKNHINRIFSKLHSVSRSEAIAAWLGTAHGGAPR
ncbi:response regulator transcription factor [Streptomyces purpureus]|uniref:DNA-binding response regulator n=1 Tax=Streptomyces purpureus TaxID=1951 RepID=A0A918HCU5_9ACTN|nr:response regulator transcription factor [Streptomyces purpureus]GGT52606.1 DNA-binding response regulator [Streptomyces purpureus]